MNTNEEKNRHEQEPTIYYDLFFSFLKHHTTNQMCKIVHRVYLLPKCFSRFYDEVNFLLFSTFAGIAQCICYELHVCVYLLPPPPPKTPDQPTNTNPPTPATTIFSACFFLYLLDYSCVRPFFHIYLLILDGQPNILYHKCTICVTYNMYVFCITHKTADTRTHRHRFIGFLATHIRQRCISLVSDINLPTTDK